MYSRIFILFFTISLLQSYVASQSCPRNVEKARRQDPTRKCRKDCSTDPNCKSENKKCICDNLCGLSCFNPDAECDAPDSAENGQVTTPDGLKYNSRAKYSCNDGYKLNGTDVRRCRSDRKWSLSEPVCVRVCPAPVRTSYAYPTSSQRSFNVPGAEVVYKCRTSHLGADSTVTCQDDYQWSPLTINCAMRTCRSPETLENGFYEGTDFNYSKTVDYKCKKGHYMIRGNLRDHHVRRCRLDGWDASLDPVSCEAVSCGYPEDLENGNVDRKFSKNNKYLGTIDFSCNTGYKLVGPEKGKCSENGTWGERPICEIDVTCDFTKSSAPTCGYTITDGRLRRTYTRNGADGFSDYVLVGSSGKLQSALYPIGNDTKCLSLNYKTSLSDAFYLQLLSPDGQEKDIRPDLDSNGWQEFETRVQELEEDDDAVSWVIVVEHYASLDNIKLLDATECPEPLTTTTLKTTSTTTPSKTTTTLRTTSRTTSTTTTATTTTTTQALGPVTTASTLLPTTLTRTTSSPALGPVTTSSILPTTLTRTTSSPALGPVTTSSTLSPTTLTRTTSSPERETVTLGGRIGGGLVTTQARTTSSSVDPGEGDNQGKPIGLYVLPPVLIIILILLALLIFRMYKIRKQKKKSSSVIKMSARTSEAEEMVPKVDA